MKNQKTMKRNQEIIKYEPLNSREHNVYEYDEPNNIVKVLDNNGVSLQPIDANYKKSKYLRKDIRLSKNGQKPYVCYPDTNFYEQPKVIKVVKKYATYEKELHNAKKSLNKEANRLSNQAANEYQNEMMRIKLTTERNLLTAKIDSLRLTNKAMLIEKNYNETYTENARHNQVMKDIERLKKLLLENSDINLKEKITEINLNRELELDNAKSNREKISEKISEQIEINKVKNQFMKERIKILSTGATPANMSKELNDEIRKVRELRSFRERDDEELEILYAALKRVDIEKIANKSDRELAMRIIEKFEADKRIKELNSSYLRENENKNNNSEKVNTIRSRIFGIINKKYSANIDNELQKKIVLEAKKETLFVSVDAQNFLATQQRSLHAYFDEYPSKNTKTKNTETKKTKKSPSKKRKSSSKKTKPASNSKKSSQLVVSKNQKRNLNRNDDYYVNYFDDDGYTSFDLNDEFFSQKAVKDAIRKWKKIEHNVESADDFDVSDVNKGVHKIKYLEKERNSKEERQNFLNFLLEKRAENKKVKQKEKMIKSTRAKSSSSSIPKENIAYYSELKLMALRRRLEKLPSDPIVFDSRNSYEYRNLMNVIAEFSQLSLRRLPKTPENDAFIIEVKQIIDFYDLLAKEDKIARSNINKSLSLDMKLRNQMIKQEFVTINKQTQNDSRYQKEVAKIEQGYRAAIQDAERQHGRKIQQINKDIEWQRNNENDLFEKNKAYIKKTSRDLEKRSHIFENHQIDALVNEINNFNKKQTNEKNIISLKNMPIKIENHEPLISGRIDLVQQDDGVYALNRVYSRTGNKTYTGKTLNTTIPTDVKKVVVLDKFRNIQNPLVRASALKELAEENYNAVVRYNLSREKSEIAKANAKLEKVKIYVDSLVDDAYEMNEYLQLVKSKSDYSSFVQREHIKRSNQKWKMTDANLKRQYLIENQELRRLENKNKKLELAQRRIESRRQKYLSSIENDVLFENMRVNATSKKQYQNESSLVPYSLSRKNEKSSNKVSFTQRLLSIFKSKKDDDIDEIVGIK